MVCGVFSSSRLCVHSTPRGCLFCGLVSLESSSNTNQAFGIAKFCHDFMNGTLGPGPDKSVFDKVEQFHTDSVVCGLSALALRTNAPTVLRDEAHEYPCATGAYTFGSTVKVAPEKAICANAAAVSHSFSHSCFFCSTFFFPSSITSISRLSGQTGQVTHFFQKNYYVFCSALSLHIMRCFHSL